MSMLDECKTKVGFGLVVIDDFKQQEEGKMRE